MWFEESVIYHIYPLGLFGAPDRNEGQASASCRIKGMDGWYEHIKELGCTAVYFGPVFESGTHGYDTHDYRLIDSRLGSNEDFAQVCRELHRNGLRVILDGVFNHVGRGFFAFRDLLEKKSESRYKDWFFVNFDGNSCYGDGFYYEGWEGHFELVKLNLQNGEVVKYILDSVGMWIDEFDIDGLRLDVAYMLNGDFLKTLSGFVRSRKQDFFLVGEMIHGDYNRLLTELDSVTNYECYKGLYSSFNSMNMFEIGHSLVRQFGREQWCLYRGRHLLSFADNHDVSRIATILSRKEHIIPLYALMFGMPGIPTLYYGSEWGAQGDKKNGDKALREAFEKPLSNEITKAVAGFAKAHKEEKALCFGEFEILHMTNGQLVFSRSFGGEKVIVCVNAQDTAYKLPGGIILPGARDLLCKKQVGDSFEIEAFGACYIKV